MHKVFYENTDVECAVVCPTKNDLFACKIHIGHRLPSAPMWYHWPDWSPDNVTAEHGYKPFKDALVKGEDEEQQFLSRGAGNGHCTVVWNKQE